MSIRLKLNIHNRNNNVNCPDVFGSFLIADINSWQVSMHGRLSSSAKLLTHENLSDTLEANFDQIVEFQSKILWFPDSQNSREFSDINIYSMHVNFKKKIAFKR